MILNRIILSKLPIHIERLYYTTQSITPSKTCLPLTVVEQSCGKYALALSVPDRTFQSPSLKHIKCPSGRPLLFSNQMLGLIASLEWNATPWIKSDARHSRPLTNLYFRADEIDQVSEPQKRRECIQKLCSFLHTDVLLHWEHRDTNEKLASKMEKYWQPILDKFQTNMNIASITKSYNFARNKLDNNLIEFVCSELESCNSLDLALIEMLACEYTSVILSLSVLKEWINMKEAIDAALLEQNHQSEYWGLDDQSHKLESYRLEQSTMLALLVSKLE